MNYINIIQAIQLPFILLIIIILLSSRIIKSVNSLKFIAFRSSFFTIKFPPLIFIALGFISNLLYIFIYISSSNGLLFSDYSILFQHRLKIILDILTAFFFFTEILINKTNRKLIFYIYPIYCLISTLIIKLNWNPTINPYGLNNLLFSTYNFLAIALIGRYSFKIIIINKIRSKIYVSNYYIITGFYIWSLLQFLPVNSEALGFSLSLIAKSLILLGLFDYSINLAKDKLDNTLVLQTAINEISKSKSIEEVIKFLIKHLTDPKYFNYNYAIFYSIDPFNHKLELAAYASSTLNITSKEATKSLDNVFSDTNRNKPSLRSKSKSYNIQNYNANSLSRSERLTLFTNVFDADTSKIINFNQLLVDNLESTDNPHVNNPIGQIEYGYYKRGNNTDPDEGKYKTSGELQIYFDNFIQTYNNLFELYVKTKLDELVDLSDELSPDNETAFLSKLLKETTDFLKYDNGILIIASSLQRDKLYTICTAYNSSPAQDLKIKNLLLGINFDIKLKYNSGTYSELISSFKSKLNFNNCVAVPIELNSFSSCLFVYSTQNKNYYSYNTEYLISTISKSVSTVYKNKLFHNSLQELISPDNNIIDLEPSIDPFFSTITRYFQSNYICLWLNKENESLHQKYSTKNFKNKCKSFGSKSINFYEYNFIPEIQLFGNENKEILFPFVDFVNKNEFSSQIHCPIYYQNRIYGFLNIYFDNSLTHLNPQDLSFLNILTVKLLTTLQVFSLVTSYKEISDSFIKNDIKQTLQTITRAAVELLSADPVMLYRSNNGKDVFFRDVTFTNIKDFNDPKILDVFNDTKENHVELAEHIINDKSVFFNEKSEYINYQKIHSKKHEIVHFQSDFWTRENIKSLAAIKLSVNLGNKIKNVGVMFINFRSEVVFNKQIKRIIETFASFASSSISNAQIFERNRQYLLQNMRMAKPILTEVLTAGALHDAHKTYKAINSMFFNLINDIEDYERRRTLTLNDIKQELDRISIPIIELFHQFNKLSELYKPSELKLQNNVDIIQVINNQLEILDHDLNDKLINVVFENDKMVPITCDKVIIGNAIYNILNNACHALDKRGTLSISVNSQTNKDIKIDISDNGKGINPEISELILEPYVSDKNDGSGLGLTMTKLAIENHGGTLKYISKEKKTTFTIILPITH